MPRIGAFFAAAVLAATALPPTPSAAFGLNLGPFHLGLPFFGFPHRRFHRHRLALRRGPENGRGVYDRATLNGTPHGTRPAPNTTQAPLYPIVAMPGVFDAIFWPANSPQWPFGYDVLFRNAFAKTGATAAQDVGAFACQQPDRTAAIIGRIRAEVRPGPTQLPLLQKLAQALGMAFGSMAKACPQTIPSQPVARLQLMQQQLQTLTMAIDLVRPPLQQFEQSLNATQKKQFAALGPGEGAAVSVCGAAPIAIDWSVDAIDQSVQSDDAQRQALFGLKQTFASIAGDLHAHCPNPLPATPLGRLEATEARLDASWRATLAMQVALGQFESKLNDQQRTRLEAMSVAPVD
jgi:LTXXQ motif family protein